jgi:hypothetical protein
VILRQAVHSRASYLGVVILDLLASGSTVAEILEDYPDLTEVDIQACIAYGAEMARALRQRAAGAGGVKFKLDENLVA